MATHRVRCGSMQKDCLLTGDPKDTVKGLDLSVVSCASPHQEVKGSVMEAEGLCQKDEDVIQGESED